MSQKISPLSFKDCITPFIIGGVLIGISVLLIKHVSPKVGAMFYAFPLGFVITIMLLYEYPDLVGEFASETVPSGVSIFLFIFIFALVFHKNDKRVWSSLLITTLIWILPTWLIFKLLSCESSCT